MYIRDLKPNEVGRDELFSVKELQRHETKTKEPYYRVTLKDKTGSATGRIWKDSFSACELDTLKPGDAVAADFETNTYNGELQIIVKKLVKTENFDMSELVAMSSKDTDAQWAKIEAHINSIEDADYKNLLLSIFSDPKIKTAFMNSPAAELVHHDFIGGLMEHILEMIAMAEAIMPFYPVINRSLVITGIILHDIGKIYEIALNETSFVRTKVGYLLGHITIGTLMLQKLLPENFDVEKRVVLEHIILSHHDELEWGAVVKPATIEASLIAGIDRTSGAVREFEKELSQNLPEADGFGKYHKYAKARIYFGFAKKPGEENS